MGVHMPFVKRCPCELLGGVLDALPLPSLPLLAVALHPNHLTRVDDTITLNIHNETREFFFE